MRGPLKARLVADAAAPPDAVEPLTSLQPFGKGLKADIKRKLPLYKSDLRDGLSLKALASVFFLFFASIAPAIGFGALLGVATGGQMGVIEMIAATALCGSSYALLSGQPLTMVGATGPVVTFIIVLSKLAASWGIAFLPFYSWVGLWSAGILALGALFSASNVLNTFTRFTDEVFAGLISFIYISNAFKDIGKLYMIPATAALPAVYVGAKACLSTIVAGIVYGSASSLKALRSTALFPQRVRETLSDFAPTIGVIGGTAVAVAACNAWGFSLTSLNVPSTFGTTAGRPWLVSLASVPVWARWAAALPAIPGSILLFMDQVITVHLVNQKDHNLKKGIGYDLDLLVLSAQIAICSLLGLPWLVAATVGSLAHLRSLATYKKTSSGGEAIESVAENRVSGLVVHLLIGAALAAAPLLGRVPLAAISGLFLYLGVASLGGNTFAERLQLLISDHKKVEAQQGDAAITKKVSMGVVRKYTLIQLGCLAALYGVAKSPIQAIAIAFPVVIAALVPARLLVEKFKLVSKDDLEVLDGE